MNLNIIAGIKSNIIPTLEAQFSKKTFNAPKNTALLENRTQ